MSVGKSMLCYERNMKMTILRKAHLIHGPAVLFLRNPKRSQTIPKGAKHLEYSCCRFVLVVNNVREHSKNNPKFVPNVFRVLF